MNYSMIIQIIIEGRNDGKSVPIRIKMESVVFNVPSIACSICSGRIKSELGGTKGINGLNIDLKSQEVKVDYDSSSISAKEIRKQIITMGYEAYQQ